MENISNSIKHASLFFLLILSTSCYGQEWEKLTPILPPGDSIGLDARLSFVDKDFGWLVTSGAMPPTYSDGFANIYSTSDGGNIWQRRYHKGMNGFAGQLEIFTLDSLNCWIAGWGLNYTNDAGNTWNYVVINLPLGSAGGGMHFFDKLNGIILGRDYIFTDDGGRSWTKGDSVLAFPPTEAYFHNSRIGFAVSNSSPCCMDAGYIAKTTDGGRSWRYIDSRSMMMYGVDFVDSLTGFAVGNNSMFRAGFIYKTIDGGESWKAPAYMDSVLEIQFHPLFDIGFLDKDHGWAVGSGSIYRTTDGGNNWECQTDTLHTYLEKIMILRKDKVAYISGRNQNGGSCSFFRADLSGLTRMEENTSHTLRYSLSENYPNPFNPQTKITYTLAEPGLVSLIVYDLLGRETANLFRGFRAKGTYTAEFDGSALSSGIYFCRFSVNGFSSVKKMMMMK